MNRKLISSQPLREDLQDLDDIGLFQSQVKKVTFDASEETKDNRENSNTIRPAQVNIISFIFSNFLISRLKMKRKI